MPSPDRERPETSASRPRFWPKLSPIAISHTDFKFSSCCVPQHGPTQLVKKAHTRPARQGATRNVSLPAKILAQIEPNRDFPHRFPVFSCCVPQHGPTQFIKESRTCPARQGANQNLTQITMERGGRPREPLPGGQLPAAHGPAGHRKDAPGPDHCGEAARAGRGGAPRLNCSAQNLGLGAQTADHWARRYVRGGSVQKLTGWWWRRSRSWTWRSGRTWPAWG